RSCMSAGTSERDRRPSPFLSSVSKPGSDPAGWSRDVGMDCCGCGCACCAGGLGGVVCAASSPVPASPATSAAASSADRGACMAEPPRLALQCGGVTFAQCAQPRLKDVLVY